MAIQREKNIKEWPRAWKTRLISRRSIRIGATCATICCEGGALHMIVMPGEGPASQVYAARTG